MKRNIVTFLILAVCLVGALAANASLIFVPNTYGMSARSIALGNAMTAVGNDYSMAYYNPGALATLQSNQVDISYLYAAPNLTGGPKDSDTDTDFNTANKLTLIGFTMNLSKLFKNEHGLGLGFDLAVDDNMNSFLEFSETRDDRGQFVRYGLSSVTMNLGLGVQAIPELHFGVGGFILVQGENKLLAETDLAGNTSQEEIQVHAQPVIAPVVGIFAPFHPMVTIGATYRGEATAKFDPIDATTDAMVSESTLTTLSLLMVFKDTFVPQQAVLGVCVKPIPDLLISVEAAWANWARYGDVVGKDDSVREDSEIETKDIFIPRLGVEYLPIENLSLRFGYYWEDTPFVEPGIRDTVILDNEKHVGSFGVGYDITQIPFLNYPLSVGATYFHQYLVPRTIKTKLDREFESSGNLNGVIGTLTLRF